MVYLKSCLKKIKNTNFKNLLFSLFIFIFLSESESKSDYYLPVGEAKTKKIVLAYPPIQTTETALNAHAQILFEAIRGDLSFMDTFRFLNTSILENPVQTSITLGHFPFSEWISSTSDFFIASSLLKNTNAHNFTFEVHVYNVFTKKEILAKKYLAETHQIKTTAHTFSNDLVATITGLPGIFLTKIVMSCENNKKKEIYFMNYDGTEVKKVTHHQSISFAPAWNSNATSIAYSVFTARKNHVKNIDLYELDLIHQKLRILSSKRGINSGAAYSPDGKTIALTLSYLGNPEIFLLDLQTGKTNQLTHSYALNVDPAWSPNGGKIAFVSSRAGAPMIFSTSLDGKSTERLTYAGRYNATPSWSPYQNKIAFAGWIEGGFDLFLMEADGSHIERLTKNQGNNEDPSFSPDGNFLVFSSNRTGQKNIYVMNRDGTFVKRLTYGLGNCTSPKWSSPQ